MEVQLRPSRGRVHPLMRTYFKHRGLGDGTCQWPQPGVPMVYPPCTGTGQTSQPDPYARDVYSATDVPGLVLPAPSNCIDSTGNVVMNDSCVNAQLAVQQENFKRIAQYNSDPVFAASFWPGVPAASIPAASTPPAVSAPPTRPAPTQVISSSMAPSPSPTSAAVNASLTPTGPGASGPAPATGIIGWLTENPTGDMFNIPNWVIVGGALAVAYFIFGGKK